MAVPTKPRGRVDGHWSATRSLAAVVVVAFAVGAFLAMTDAAHARAVPTGGSRNTLARSTTTSTAAPVTSSTSSTPPTTSTTLAGPPFTTSTRSVTLTDTTRSSPARDGAPGSPIRSLRTLVVAPVTIGGPLPVIVFAQGYDTEPESYMTLLQDWASAGYLVLAPESPDSASDLPGTPIRSDVSGQAQDLSFVVTAALAGTFGPVDPGRVSAAGHSDGGSAVATVALNSSYHDSRIGNYLVLSGAIPDGVDGSWGTAPETGRLLVVVGDEDEYGNLPASTEVYDTATMAKTLAVARGGDHMDTYLADTVLAQQVRAETLAFLAGTVSPGSLELSSSAAS